MFSLQNKNPKEIREDMEYWILQFDGYSLFMKQELEEDYLSASFQDVINQYKKRGEK